MAVDSTPLLTRRTTILAKTETTTGTAIALADTDGAFNAYNVTWTPNIAIEQRPAQAGYGQLKAVRGSMAGTISFEVDLAGNGASGVATWASTLLTAAGFTASGGVFTTGYAASQPTLTLGAYFDDLKVAISGSVGSVTFPLRAGFPCRPRFEFSGKLEADADVAFVTPTGLTTLPPRFAGSTVTFGSYTPILDALEININNTLSPREYQGDATGIKNFIITDQNIEVTADPELSLAAARDWYTLLTGHTAESMSVAIGSDANNTMTFACTSNLQWTGIGIGERNGKRVRQATGQINNSGLTLTFT